MKCPNCGNENPPDYVFCDECGARLQGGDDSAAMSQLSDTADGGGMPVGSHAHMDSSGSGGAAGNQGAEHAAGAAYAASGPSTYMGISPEAPTTQHNATSGGYGAPSGSGDQMDFMTADSVDGPRSNDSIGGVSQGAEVGAIPSVHQMGDASAGNGQAGQAGQGAFDQSGNSGSPADTSDAMAGSMSSPAVQGLQSAPLESSNTEMSATEGALQGFDAGISGQQQDVAEGSREEPGGMSQEVAMPGVTPIGSQDQASMQPGINYAPADVFEEDVAGASMTGGGAYTDVEPSTGVGMMDGQSGQSGQSRQGEWAGEALRRLDRAQQALRDDDWILFGQGMADLRLYLMSVGATATSAATGASSQPAYMSTGSDQATKGAQAEATGSSPQSMVYGDGGTGGMGSTAQSTPYSAGSDAQDQGYTPATQLDDNPMLEPAAEAGTLPADASVGSGAGTDPNYGVDFDSGADVGYAGTDQSGSADTGMADAAAGSGVAAMSGSGGAAASSASSAGSGMGMSSNGTVENMLARLVIISTGAELPLPDQEEITVGREDPSSGIFPDVDLTPYGGEEGGVSRRHARMLFVNGEYFVEDLQSTNFTKLDGQRLPAHVRERLEDGARIDFGRVATIFRRS